MRVQKPRLKIQMLFRARGGRSRRTRRLVRSRKYVFFVVVVIVIVSVVVIVVAIIWLERLSLSFSFFHVSCLVTSLVIIVLTLSPCNFSSVSTRTVFFYLYPSFSSLFLRIWFYLSFFYSIFNCLSHASLFQIKIYIYFSNSWIKRTK